MGRKGAQMANTTRLWANTNKKTCSTWCRRDLILACKIRQILRIRTWLSLISFVILQIFKFLGLSFRSKRAACVVTPVDVGHHAALGFKAQHGGQGASLLVGRQRDPVACWPWRSWGQVAASSVGSVNWKYHCAHTGELLRKYELLQLIWSSRYEWGKAVQGGIRLLCRYWPSSANVTPDGW